MGKELGLDALRWLQAYRKLNEKKAEGLSSDEEKLLKELESKIAAFIDPKSPESFRHQRKALRVNAEITVSIQDRGEMNRLFIKNISGGGLYIATTENYEMGKKIKVLLQLPEETASHEIDVEVAWLNPKGVGHLPPGMGVKFVQIPPEARRKIDQMIERQVEKTIKELPKKFGGPTSPGTKIKDPKKT